jgi:hypothetical protein
LTTGGEERVYAVNLPPAESRTDSIDPLAALTDFGVRVARDDRPAPDGADSEEEKQQRQRQEAAEKEAGQKLWKLLVLAVLGILLVETGLAGRRRRLGGALEPVDAG